MGLFDRFRKKAQPEAQPPEQSAQQPAAPAQTREPGRLRLALNRTRAFLATAFAADPSGLVDDEFYEELCDGFVMADVSLELAGRLVERIRQGMADRGLVTRRDALLASREVLLELFAAVRPAPQLNPEALSVIMLVGVNGSGKTTLAAKLAHKLKREGRSVLLVAADTFRAAATGQLKLWAERVGVDIVSGAGGSDPASVVFDGATAAAARGAEVLLVDTAGRLQTRSNLMQELGKIARTLEKACPGANLANILVLDATVGQNALSQARLFDECCNLAGLAITKLDGTARGGAVLAVVETLKLPVLYAGVGETAEDLLEFDAAEFVSGLLPELS